MDEIITKNKEKKLRQIYKILKRLIFFDSQEHKIKN